MRKERRRGKKERGFFQKKKSKKINSQPLKRQQIQWETFFLTKKTCWFEKEPWLFPGYWIFNSLWIEKEPCHSSFNHVHSMFYRSCFKWDKKNIGLCDKIWQIVSLEAEQYNLRDFLVRIEASQEGKWKKKFYIPFKQNWTTWKVLFLYLTAQFKKEPFQTKIGKIKEFKKSFNSNQFLNSFFVA